MKTWIEFPRLTWGSKRDTSGFRFFFNQEWDSFWEWTFIRHQKIQRYYKSALTQITHQGLQRRNVLYQQHKIVLINCLSILWHRLRVQYSTEKTRHYTRRDQYAFHFCEYSFGCLNNNVKPMDITSYAFESTRAVTKCTIMLF